MRNTATNLPELDELLRLAEFPDVDHATWKQRVEEELGEATFADPPVTHSPGGIEVEPLYSAGSAPGDGEHLYLGRWAGKDPFITEEYPIPDLDEARVAIAAGCRRRIHLAWLPVRYGADPPTGDGSPRGIRIADVDELLALVGEFPASTEPAIEVIGDLKPLEAVVDFGAWSFSRDPIGEAFRGDGDELLERALDDQVEFVVRRRGNPGFGLRTVLVASSPFHEAGASAVDELALALATGVEFLRRLTIAGFSVSLAACRMVFAFSVTDDVFLEIAKLRAARLLWSKVLSASGIVGDCGSWFHARGSEHGFSERDPRTNLLRNTVRCFAAVVGGADSVALTPYDWLSETPSAGGRRLVAVTQRILEEEAGITHLADPAGGSWYLGALTDRLARAAWKLFQEVESGGGMVHCLQDGRVHELVRRSAERHQAAAGESG